MVSVDIFVVAIFNKLFVSPFILVGHLCFYYVLLCVRLDRVTFAIRSFIRSIRSAMKVVPRRYECCDCVFVCMCVCLSAQVRVYIYVQTFVIRV